MKQISWILILLLILTSCTDKQSGVLKIAKPNNWESVNSDFIEKNLERHDVQSAKETFKTEFKRSKVLYAYKKYPTSKHKSLNPSIKIEIRNNSHNSDSEFFKSTREEFKNWFKYFNGYRVEDEPKIKEFDGMKALSFSVTYSFIDNDTVWYPRSKVLIFPSGNKSYQIFLNDSKEDNCSETFNKLLSSIKFE